MLSVISMKYYRGGMCMNELKIFENKEFGKVRMVLIDDTPYFVGKDVAEILGYKNPNEAIQDHVDNDDKFMRSTRGSEMLKLFSTVKNIQDKFGRQDNWFINESGIYSLVFGSKLPIAKKFKRWVTSEVLPSIRKNGVYSLEIPKTLPEALRAYADEVEKNAELAKQNYKLEHEVVHLNETINEMKPKADYVDRILSCKKLMPVTLIAKDYGYSGKRFNKILHDNGVQYKVGKQWVLYSKYQGCGYTHSKQYPEITDSKGEFVSNMEWTQKGRLFLYDFLKKRNILPTIEQA